MATHPAALGLGRGLLRGSGVQPGALRPGLLPAAGVPLPPGVVLCVALALLLLPPLPLLLLVAVLGLALVSLWAEWAVRGTGKTGCVSSL